MPIAENLMMKLTKHLKVAILLGGMVMGAMRSSATIVENVTLGFASGATWSGTISFYDGYEGMFATSGLLTGGTNNYNMATNWTWWEGTNQPNPASSLGGGLYNDWLMNGSPSSWSNFIGVNWDPALSVLSGGVSFQYNSNTYYNGIGTDAITSYQVGSVPDTGSTLSLFGAAALALGLGYRKRR